MCQPRSCLVAFTVREGEAHSSKSARALLVYFCPSSNFILRSIPLSSNIQGTWATDPVRDPSPALGLPVPSATAPVGAETAAK